MLSRPAATRHPSQLLTLGIGAAYTLVGPLGLVVTGFGEFAAETDKDPARLRAEPAPHLVHLLIGLAGLAMWRQPAPRVPDRGHYRTGRRGRANPSAPAAGRRQGKEATSRLVAACRS